MAKIKRSPQGRSSDGNSSSTIRKANVGRLLLLSYRRFEKIAMSELKDEGFTDLRLPHFQILPQINEDGVTVSDIANAMNLTKQAISQIANELQRAGYLVRTANPQDGRAKLLLLTPRGHQLLAVLPAVVTRTEKAIELMIDEIEFVSFKRQLQRIAYYDDEYLNS